MLLKIEIIARKPKMTQCEEIKKKLQKILPVHTLDEKLLEHLPEFDDPLDFKRTLYRQCQSAASDLSYLGCYVSCVDGDLAEMFQGIYQGNRLAHAWEASTDAGCAHSRFLGASLIALACNDKDFVEKAMPLNLEITGTKVSYNTISNLFMGIFYQDKAILDTAVVQAEKYLAGKQRSYDNLIVQYLQALWEKDTNVLTDLLEQICKAEQRVNENNSYVAYGQEKYNKIINLIVHGLYALAEHYLGTETFETLDTPDDKSFYKEYELYRREHTQTGENLLTYHPKYGYLNRIINYIPEITLKLNSKKQVIDTDLFADTLFEAIYKQGEFQDIIKKDAAWSAAWGRYEDFRDIFQNGNEGALYYDRGLIYYALSNHNPEECYKIASFLLTENKSLLGFRKKQVCILEKQTRDFDGPYHYLFRREKYDIARTVELCQLLLEAGADPNQAGEKNILPIELMMAMPFSEEELMPVYEFWFHLPEIELKLYTFDGKRPIDFAKKYKRKYLSSWIQEHM